MPVLNTTAKRSVNNRRSEYLVYCPTLTVMHPTTERLFKAAAELRGLNAPAEVARALEESQQTLKHWEARGMSQRGIVRACTLFGLSPEWLEKGLEPMLAHSMSHEADTVASFTWEELMQTEDLPALFWVTLGDDAMAPRAPKGTKVRFRRAKARDFELDGQYGDAVLFLAPDLTHHVRLLGQDLSHGFQLRPTNSNYASFVGSMAGLELLGIMTAIETNWQQLDR
jgi:hypothetical protein